MKTLGTHYVTMKTDTHTVFILIVQGPHSESSFWHLDLRLSSHQNCEK